MDAQKLFKLLSDPKVYGVGSVEIKQTHISFVVLTGELVYKVKKPVNFGFLDFSTIEKRKFYCEEEIRLNRRLSPDVYLGVVAITEDGGTIEFDGKGKVIDYAVKMRQLDNSKMMSLLLERREIKTEDMEALARTISDFHKVAETNAKISSFGGIDKIRFNAVEENFDQTLQFIDVTIKSEYYDFIRKRMEEFLREFGPVFERRVKEGRIRECHGDLHSGNIFIIDGKPVVFDCIEFNERFRYADVATDVAFLAMDLDHLKKRIFSQVFVRNYIEFSGDNDVDVLLNFYKCYYAYVRGKVISFKLLDPNVSEEEKESSKNEAEKYFVLAYEYANRFKTTDIEFKRPVLFINVGLSGTGKSRWGRIIADYFKAVIRSSDIQRKRLKNIIPSERVKEDFGKGIYDEATTDETYSKLMDQAQSFLSKGKNVMLDATFIRKKHRDMAQQAAEKCGADMIILYFSCPESIIKERLMRRTKMKNVVSDANWDIYLKQKEIFEEPEGKNVFHISTPEDYEQETLKRIEGYIRGL